MSKFFWQKTRNVEVADHPDIVDVGDRQPTDKIKSAPLPVQIVNNDDEDTPRFEIDQLYLPPVAGQTVTRLVKVTGLTTGSAYTSGDVFGDVLTFHNVFRSEKNSGTIVRVVLIDLDAEGLAVELPIYNRKITAGTNDSAYDVSDADGMFCETTIPITTFYNYGGWQVGKWTGTEWVVSTDCNLYTQLCTRGAQNIAAGSEPWIKLTVVPD